MSTPPVLPPDAIRPDGTVDVARLIAAFDDTEHARRADLYFTREHMPSLGLHKPWGTLVQTDESLDKLRAALQLAKLFRMARVLDFGCGTGWLARVLARLGMRVHACDVAATALRIGEAFARGEDAEIAGRIRWHLLDGPRIPLPDAAVDRVICFDALHHVPDPAPVLGEMARVLVPGGVAVFVEPNERHSLSPSSQKEMRQYGVIENDFDIFAVARMAEEHGLRPGEVALTMRSVPTLSLAGFAREWDRARAGTPPDPVVTAQVFATLDPNTKDRRLFSLLKGDAIPDSRAIAPAAEDGSGAAGRLLLQRCERVGEAVKVEILVDNPGPFRWIAPDGTPRQAGVVQIGVMRRDASGALQRDWRRIAVPAEALQPGGSALVQAKLRPPEGTVALRFDLVSEYVCWFGVGVEAPLS